MPIRLWRAEAGPASRLSVRSEMKVAQWRACLTGSATELAQHSLFRGCSTKQLAQHAIKRLFSAIFRALGELFRARTHHRTEQGELFRVQAAVT